MFSEPTGPNQIRIPLSMYVSHTVIKIFSKGLFFSDRFVLSLFSGSFVFTKNGSLLTLCYDC